MFRGKLFLLFLSMISLGTSAAFADFRSLIAKDNNTYHVIRGKPARDPAWLGFSAFTMGCGGLLTACVGDVATKTGDYIGGMVYNFNAFKDGRASTWGKRLFRVGCIGVCATGATFWGGVTLAGVTCAMGCFGASAGGLAIYATEREEVK